MAISLKGKTLNIYWGKYEAGAVLGALAASPPTPCNNPARAMPGLNRGDLGSSVRLRYEATKWGAGLTLRPVLFPDSVLLASVYCDREVDSDTSKGFFFKSLYFGGVEGAPIIITSISKWLNPRKMISCLHHSPVWGQGLWALLQAVSHSVPQAPSISDPPLSPLGSRMEGLFWRRAPGQACKQHTSLLLIFHWLEFTDVARLHYKGSRNL